MASALAAQNPWEEAACSLCLDYFKDPVTLECGHNLCRACLPQCWEKSGNTDAPFCPFCRGKVLQKTLRKKWQLANIIVPVKKLNPNYEGEKGGKQEPVKLFCEDHEITISLVLYLPVFYRSKEQYDHRVVPLGKAVQDCKDTNRHLQKSEKKETFKKPGAFSPELKWKIREVSDQKSDQTSFIKQFQDLFVLQTSIVILEAYSACSFLTQSDGHKSVKHGTEPQDLRDNPEKFSNPMCVLRRKGFTTHFYADGFVKGREGIWPVEVATKSLRGKGHGPIRSKEQIWAMGKWIGGCPDSSLPCCSVLSLSEKTKEVQGYLNRAARQVGFFDGEMGAQIDAILEVPLSAVSVQPFFYM